MEILKLGGHGKKAWIEEARIVERQDFWAFHFILNFVHYPGTIIGSGKNQHNFCEDVWNFS